MTRAARGDLKTTPLQIAALVVAAALLVVGALGFVPGVNEDYDGLAFTGPDSDAELFGLFRVSVLHNAVHLAFGVIGLAMASAPANARRFLMGAGVVYLALWAYGLVVDPDSAANLIPLNYAGSWLHFGLGAGMLILGATLAGRRSRAR